MGKSVAVVDPATKTVALTYQLGFTPGMAKPTPAGDTLLVTNGDDGKLVFNMLGMDRKSRRAPERTESNFLQTAGPPS